MGDIIQFPLLRRQDAIALEVEAVDMADVERSDFELEVSQEEFDTDYAPAESFEGTYDGSEGTFDRDDCPPRLVGSATGEWLHRDLRNAARCARCGSFATAGWSWYDPAVAKCGEPVGQQFTCDDCAEKL